MDHVMIDIETMGKRYDAPILSIGAVFFDPDRPENPVNMASAFFRGIDPEDAFRHGVADGDTVRWWMHQGDLARAAAVSGRAPLAFALDDLAKFIAREGPLLTADLRVWGNGPTFDITILEHAYARLGVAVPWSFRCVRDCRTINDLAAAIGFDTMARPPALAPHSALDDAIWQATWVSAKWQALRSRAEAAA